MGRDTCGWRRRGSGHRHTTACSSIPLPGGELSTIKHRKLGRVFVSDFLYRTSRVYFSFGISRGKLVVLVPVCTSTPHVVTSHTPFTPAGRHLSPHLDGNFWLLPCLFKIKMAFRVSPPRKACCQVHRARFPMHRESKGLLHRCFPWPAISLLSQGYGGGVRVRAVHALLPLKSHLNNHGKGKQQRSANPCVGDVFIFGSEICPARTASSGAHGSPRRQWHLKLSAREQGFKCEEITQLKTRCCRC